MISITTMNGNEVVTKEIAKSPEAPEVAKPQAEQNSKEVKDTKPASTVETTSKTAKEADDKKEKDDFSYLEDDDETETPEESEDDDLDEEDDPKSKKSGFQKRIDKLTKEKKEAEARERALEDRLSQLEKKLSGDNKPEKKEVITKLEKPKLDDFEDYTDYNEALMDWKLAIAEEQKQEKAREEEVTKKSEEIRQAWNKKTDEAAKKYKDWGEIAKSNLPLHPFSRAEIMQSEVGADIVYYLYKNPSVAEEISNLSQAAQIKRIAKIEDRLEAKLKSIKPRSDAESPEPIKPINSSVAKGSSKNDPFKEVLPSLDAYKKWRERNGKKN